MAKRKVTIQIDQGFFDNIFERDRKKLEKKLGLNNMYRGLSQNNFTKILSNANITLMPKNLKKSQIQNVFENTKKKRRRS